MQCLLKWICLEPLLLFLKAQSISSALPKSSMAGASIALEPGTVLIVFPFLLFASALTFPCRYKQIKGEVKKKKGGGGSRLFINTGLTVHWTSTTQKSRSCQSQRARFLSLLQKLLSNAPTAFHFTTWSTRQIKNCVAYYSVRYSWRFMTSDLLR